MEKLINYLARCLSDNIIIVRRVNSSENYQVLFSNYPEVKADSSDFFHSSKSDPLTQSFRSFLNSQKECDTATVKFNSQTYELFMFRQHASDNDTAGMVIKNNTLKEMFQKRSVDLLSLVSHEIRTPLTVISGYLQLLLSEKEEDPMVKTIFHNCQKLARNLDNLLISSDAVNNILKTSPRLTDLSIVVKKAISRFQKSINEKSIRLILNCSECFVMADRIMLMKAMLNLIDNACQFCPVSGQILISIKKSGGNALLTVENSLNSKIPDPDLLWTPFFQQEEISTRKTEGLGLGLNTVREIVLLHQGKCWLTADSVFRISIELPLPSNNTVNVLIVDDEAFIRKILSRMLENQNVVLFSASSALQALDIISDSQVDLVFLDIVMPEMDGFEAATKIRAVSPEARICFMSGINDAISAKKALEAGGDDYIVKPFEASQILEQLEMSRKIR